jgi:hypothetical protein
MASAGPNSPGTAANNTAVGTVAWGSPDNIKASDNVRALVANEFSAITSNYIQASNFGFSIPTGATIDGILVEIEIRDNAGTGQVYDSAVKIVKADGSVGSTNKASGTAWPDLDTYRSYGSSSDLWGESWSAENINDSDFGVVMSVTIDGFFGAAGVDHIRITVTYTEGGGGASAVPAIMNSYRQRRA